MDMYVCTHTHTPTRTFETVCALPAALEESQSCYHILITGRLCTVLSFHTAIHDFPLDICTQLWVLWLSSAYEVHIFEVFTREDVGISICISCWNRLYHFTKVFQGTWAKAQFWSLYCLNDYEKSCSVFSRLTQKTHHLSPILMRQEFVSTVHNEILSSKADLPSHSLSQILDSCHTH